MAISTQPWGFFCCKEDEGLVFGRLEQSSWEKTPLTAQFYSEGSAQDLAAFLPRRHAMAALARDAAFLEALRNAAIMVCLAPGLRLCCKIRENQQALAEAAIFDVYSNALPQQQFLSFAAGTQLPEEPFQLLLSPVLPEGDWEGALVDFTAEQPTLQMRFLQLNFAQRTLCALLPPLGLGLTLSMWNAACRLVQARLGSQAAAQYTDLITWIMLRKNFSANQYPITGPEHTQLLARVKEYEAAA